MPYVLDENENHIIDENGDKVEFSISYVDSGILYKHKESIHINDDDHFDTENRNIVIKDGIKANHAVCKKQLDQLNKNIKQYIDNELRILQNSITSSINNLKSQMLDTASKPNSNNFNNFNNRFNN